MHATQNKLDHCHNIHDELGKGKGPLDFVRVRVARAICSGVDNLSSSVLSTEMAGWSYNTKNISLSTIPLKFKVLEHVSGIGTTRIVSKAIWNNPNIPSGTVHNAHYLSIF